MHIFTSCDVLSGCNAGAPFRKNLPYVANSRFKQIKGSKSAE